MLRAVLICAVPLSVCAQNTHEMKFGREAAIIGITLPLNFMGSVMPAAGDPSWDFIDRAAVLGPIGVNGFDRIATRRWSIPDHRRSNAIMGIAAAGSLAAMIVQQRGDDPMLPAGLWAESFLVSSGLTTVVKWSVQRTRPYAFNPDLPLETKRRKDAMLSFWSGHTANTAALTFSCAAVLDRSDLTRGQRDAVWIGAAALPIAVGFFRVRSGRHFPTDVLAGFAAGALVGWAVPYFHRPESFP